MWAHALRRLRVVTPHSADALCAKLRVAIGLGVHADGGLALRAITGATERAAAPVNPSRRAARKVLVVHKRYSIKQLIRKGCEFVVTRFDLHALLRPVCVSIDVEEAELELGQHNSVGGAVTHKPEVEADRFAPIGRGQVDVAKLALFAIDGRVQRPVEGRVRDDQIEEGPRIVCVLHPSHATVPDLIRHVARGPANLVAVHTAKVVGRNIRTGDVEVDNG